MESNELSDLPLLRRYEAEGIAAAGLDDEIRDRMKSIEPPDGSPDEQAAQDYERLASVLEEAQPQLAARAAGRLGRSHGRDAARRWQQEALGGVPTAESVALARRVLLGVQQGDESAFDVLPRPSDRYMAIGLAADCGWPEPDVEDRLEHHRWDVAQFAVNDAYEVAFTDALFASVAEACRSQISHAPTSVASLPAAPAPEPQPRPILRPARVSGSVPNGWEVVPAGRNQWGDDLEAVYDPRRCDVLVTHSQRGVTSSLATEALDALTADGWTELGSHGTAAVFWRDRVAQVRAALDRSTPNQGLGIEGPGL